MATDTRRTPQWDDWRCYRCHSWQAGDARRYAGTPTPSGAVLPVCADCWRAEQPVPDSAIDVLTQDALQE